MKLEELIRLNEEDLFGKQKSISTEQSDLLKNLAYIGNINVFRGFRLYFRCSSKIF